MTKSSHSNAAEEIINLAAMVRAYVPVPGRATSRKPQEPKPQKASDWALIFDTETTVDAAQTLRVGAYQLRKKSDLVEQGLFYEPIIVSEKEKQILVAFAAKRGLPLLTRDEFVDDVFFAKGYELRASIIGFNLPFDIARIACRHNSARGKTFGDGGFTFQLSANPKRAHVQVKHLNSKAALIQFAQEAVQRTPRGARRRGQKVGIRRGTFIDVKTLAAALLSQSHSLASLTEALQTPTRKQASDEHGGRLTGRYLDYALQDVQATWECFLALQLKYSEHGLAHTPINRILSEASVGKAHLRQLDVRPFREVQPDFPDELLGRILSTYYGGRSEVRWRGTIKQVFYSDFLSMYPTVCTLMGLWKFITSDGLEWSDATDDTRTFLDSVTLADVRLPKTWARLHTIVEIKPQNDILPLRARYDGVSPTIGLNAVTSDQSLWYTLADVIAAKILSGKTPKIESAISFTPKDAQTGLRPAKIGGTKIDPVRDDLFKILIDQRSRVKVRISKASGAEKLALQSSQLALKIIANATSYGIFVEVIVSNLDKEEERLVFGPSGSSFPVATTKSEEPGPFFHPLIATLITGAARLMLATAERLALDAGMDWAFCDTDSMAFAKPDDMPSEDFIRISQSVTNWFDDLNPYEMRGPLFKIEDANFGLDENSKKLHPLFCLCISSKRYALFNLGDAGRPVVRKASAHGLGHLRAPYSAREAPTSIPTPRPPLRDVGVERWQHDLWYQMICAAIDGHPKELCLDYHPALKSPVASRYGATRPQILRWFNAYNQGRPYHEQVKPFGFLNSLQTDLFASSPSDADRTSRTNRQPLRPIAPFDKDPRVSARQAFDRLTGADVSKEALKSYRATLTKYPLSPEAKFLNGEPFDNGRTEHRHVRANSITHIGKEANKWEEQHYLGAGEAEQIEYGPSLPAEIDARLEALRKSFGERASARRLGISRETFRKSLREGVEKMSAQVQARLKRL